MLLLLISYDKVAPKIVIFSFCICCRFETECRLSLDSFKFWAIICPRGQIVQAGTPDGYVFWNWRDRSFIGRSRCLSIRDSTKFACYWHRRLIPRFVVWLAGNITYGQCIRSQKYDQNIPNMFLPWQILSWFLLYPLSLSYLTEQ